MKKNRNLEIIQYFATNKTNGSVGTTLSPDRLALRILLAKCSENLRSLDTAAELWHTKEQSLLIELWHTKNSHCSLSCGTLKHSLLIELWHTKEQSLLNELWHTKNTHCSIRCSIQKNTRC